MPLAHDDVAPELITKMADTATVYATCYAAAHNAAQKVLDETLIGDSANAVATAADRTATYVAGRLLNIPPLPPPATIRRQVPGGAQQPVPIRHQLGEIAKHLADDARLEFGDAIAEWIHGHGIFAGAVDAAEDTAA